MKLLPVTEGERVRNAFNGETFIFTHLSENAEVVRFDVYLEPGGMLTGTGMQHVHPGADEKFTVISGKLAVVVDGAPRMVEPGQSLNVLRGTPHYFRNGHGGKHSLRSVFSPGNECLPEASKERGGSAALEFRRVLVAPAR